MFPKNISITGSMQISKITILQTYFCLFTLRSCFSEAKYFRSNPLELDDDEELTIRQLDWSFVTENFDDDVFFGGYDKDEIPRGSAKSKSDSKDYLRTDDVCPDRNGSLAKDHCRRPPKCDKSSKKFGDEKLCINRAFVPGDEDSWYVVAMKCIPKWENCDKCFCGKMANGDSMDGYCEYDDSAVRDDRVDLECDDMSVIEMMGHSYSFSEASSDSHSYSFSEASSDSEED